MRFFFFVMVFFVGTVIAGCGSGSTGAVDDTPGYTRINPYTIALDSGETIQLQVYSYNPVEQTYGLRIPEPNGECPTNQGEWLKFSLGSMYNSRGGYNIQSDGGIVSEGDHWIVTRTGRIRVWDDFYVQQPDGSTVTVPLELTMISYPGLILEPIDPGSGGAGE